MADYRVGRAINRGIRPKERMLGRAGTISRLPPFLSSKYAFGIRRNCVSALRTERFKRAAWLLVGAAARGVAAADTASRLVAGPLAANDLSYSALLEVVSGEISITLRFCEGWDGVSSGG